MRDQNGVPLDILDPVRPVDGGPGLPPGNGNAANATQPWLAVARYLSEVMPERSRLLRPLIQVPPRADANIGRAEFQHQEPDIAAADALILLRGGDG